MHPAAMNYVSRFATPEQISVIEIGSRNINGTARDLFLNAEWLGVDIVDGPMVDVVCDAEDFQPDNLADMVICCEVFEHTAQWKQIIQRAVKWLKPGGRMVITCAGTGRTPHSAVDGEHRLLHGEHYKNITEYDLLIAMMASGLRYVVTERNDDENDTYGTGCANDSTA